MSGRRNRRNAARNFMSQHTVETGNSHSDLINMMRRHSTNTEHPHFCLANHLFDKPIHNLPVMPFITKVSFLDTTIKNGSILRFKKWCPNVNELAFVCVRFSHSAYEKFLSPLMDDDDVMPGVKKLTFSFNNWWCMFGNLAEELDGKFPSLEDFTLILDTTDDESGYEPTWDVDAPYQPMYFKNLRKFSLFTFCGIDEAVRIFENMDMCNAKLEELSFTGMILSPDNIRWISSCRKLRKLTLKFDFIEESDMNELKAMQSLTLFKLIVDEMEWEPMQIIEFVRSNQHVKLVSIICGPKCKKLKFGDDFKAAFDQLARDRNDLSIKLTYNKHRERQIIKITKEGIVASRVPRAADDSDDDLSFDGYENHDDENDDSNNDENGDEEAESSAAHNA